MTFDDPTPDDKPADDPPLFDEAGNPIFLDLPTWPGADADPSEQIRFLVALAGIQQRAISQQGVMLHRQALVVADLIEAVNRMALRVDILAAPAIGLGPIEFD